jgi:Tfp pilus assembly protein PilV
VAAADRRSVLERLRSQTGFGLIELLISMTMLNVAILALVAAFQSGGVALQRAGRISTASALADQQMEVFRAVTYPNIFLDTASESTARTDSTYNCDTALTSCSSGVAQVTATCTPLTGESGEPPARCNPRLTLLGPDQHKYRIDTYVVAQYPTGSAATSRQNKLVTVVVRDGLNLARVLGRESSTFDIATG